MSKVRDTDKGAKAMLERVFGFERPKIKVGILDKGDTPHRDSALTILEVAMFHEFGLGVPQRSFIRAWFDENQSRARALVRTLLVQVVKGRITKEQMLNRLGLAFVGEIQQRITRGIPPPLEEPTAVAKGSSTPLVDTGQLRSSIQYKVEK